MSHTPHPTLLRRAAATAAAVVFAASLAGCGTSLHNPYANDGLNPASTTATTQTGTTVTYTGTPPSERNGTVSAAAMKAQNGVTPGTALATPQAALTRFARTWGTWTSHTLPAVQAEVAAMSVGGARDQARQAVVSWQADPTLKHSNLRSTTTVVAISQGYGAAAGYWVVTTSEKLTGRGAALLAPTLHVNYANVTHTAHGWVVSTWSPQS